MKVRLFKHRAHPPVPALVYDAEYDYEDWDSLDPWNQRDTTCDYCSGTGGDPWNDGITPCPHCDGEGYEWWN